MIDTALSKTMAGEVGRTYGLTGHPYLSMYVTNLGDRPGLLIDVELPVGAAIEDGQGFDIVEVPGSARGRILVKPTRPGIASPAFVGLVEFVFRETAEAGSKADAVVALMDAVQEFRAFFARRADRLGETAIRGLFTELQLLVDLVELGFNAQDALQAWAGPYRGADFRFADNAAIEVKSMHGATRTVQISSEHQLVTPAGGMHLFVRELTTLSPQSTTGRALLELVSEVKSVLVGSPAAKELWDSAMQALGFDETDGYYKQWRFSFADWQAYAVREGFPRITPNVLPTGLHSVAYVVQLDAIQAFREDAQIVLEEVATAYG